MEKEPCQQAEMRDKELDILSLTLEQFFSLASQLVSDLVAAALPGEASIPMMLDASLRRAAERDAVLYWVARATAALCRLRSWKATNEYAITLPLKRLLRSCTLGPQLVMEVYSNLLAALVQADAVGLVVIAFVDTKPNT